MVLVLAAAAMQVALSSTVRAVATVMDLMQEIALEVAKSLSIPLPGSLGLYVHGGCNGCWR